MKKKIYIAVIAVLAVVFCVSAFMVGSYIVESRQQAKAAEELAALKNATAETAEQTEAATEAETVPEGTFGAAEDLVGENDILTDYGHIYEQNNDLVGWIRIDGTKLDYPVM